MTQVAEDWLAEHTVAAPERLRERLFQALADASVLETERVSALVAAADATLTAAIKSGNDRAAALDLLAADALITLALLAVAEQDPAHLESTARALRLGQG